MSILVDAENFGYGYEKVTFSKLEQTNFELAVSMFRTKISWLITETQK
jgi:RHH-type rel operon transcriptional repressor/antitoxin RelB